MNAVRSTALFSAAVLASGVMTAGPGGRAAAEAVPGNGGRATAGSVAVGVLPQALVHAPGTGQAASDRRRAHPIRSVSFDGLGQGDPGLVRPSDVNAAVGTADMLEVVNSRLAVYTKTGGRRCAVDLADLFGAGEELLGPRVLYDVRYRRYSLLATVEPAAGAATLFVASTQAADPCAAWWTYRLTFSGPLFPPGSRLDRPGLGQDARSLLLSSDSFLAGRYVGSAAFALAKSAVYAGAPVRYQAFEVSFATVPVTSDQTVGAVTAHSHYLAAVPGQGYLLYRMVNSADPDGALLLLEAAVAAPYAAPARRVRQCGAGTLDPLDGRIAAPAVRAGGYVWFTHGFDAAGRPGVRYGAISLLSHTPFLAVAARSGTSDDFNPSIAVDEVGDGYVYAWLNWAFTDVGNRPCTDASAIADGVEPGAGVHDLIGGGVVFARGEGSGSDAPFGASSSAVVDPVPDAACAAGWTAVVAQQYFGAGGRWRTRLARVSSC